MRMWGCEARTFGAGGTRPAVVTHARAVGKAHAATRAQSSGAHVCQTWIAVPVRHSVPRLRFCGFDTLASHASAIRGVARTRTRGDDRSRVRVVVHTPDSALSSNAVSASEVSSHATATSAHASCSSRRCLAVSHQYPRPTAEPCATATGRQTVSGPPPVCGFGDRE